MSEYAIFKKKCFYGTLERRYFCDVFDHNRLSIPFSWSCHKENSQNLCSSTSCVKLAGVHRSEPCVCYVRWTSVLFVDSLYHKSELDVSTCRQTGDEPCCRIHYTLKRCKCTSWQASKHGLTEVDACRNESLSRQLVEHPPKLVQTMEVKKAN